MCRYGLEQDTFLVFHLSRTILIRVFKEARVPEIPSPIRLSAVSKCRTSRCRDRSCGTPLSTPSLSLALALDGTWRKEQSTGSTLASPSFAGPFTPNTSLQTACRRLLIESLLTMDCPANGRVTSFCNGTPGRGPRDQTACWSRHLLHPQSVGWGGTYVSE